MIEFILTLIGLILGAGGVFLYFKFQGAQHLRKIEEANEKKIAIAHKRLAEIEQKAAVAETKLKEKILDAKNRALEIVEEAKKRNRA